MYSEDRTLLIVLGPTGAGKSALAIRLAEAFSGEVISCDSMQVYRGFDIGTDKLPEGERHGIPHHLLDIIDPDRQFTAADFVRRTLAVISDIRSRDKLPILAGGTGLYFKALLEGLFPLGRVDPGIRRRLQERADLEGLDSLWLEVNRVDPDYAALIGRRDRVRILRALEVHGATGRSLSSHFRDTRSPVKDEHRVIIGLELERTELYARINQRVDRMFSRGMVDEVRGLLDKGVPRDAPPFRALGYAQILRYLAREISLEESIELTKIATRHYAKRQMTWFRRTPGVSWLSPHKPEEIITHVRKRRRPEREGHSRPPFGRSS